MRSMAKVFLTVASLMLLASCSQDSPIAPGGSAGAGFTKDGHQFLVNGYVVQYDGRDYDGENSTFHYTVLGAGNETRATQFRLELPECAGELSSWSPMLRSRFYTDGDGSPGGWLRLRGARV